MGKKNKEQKQEEKRKKRFISSLKEYKKTAESRVKYSLERFDILVISLSSGGLALSASMYENFEATDKTFIDIAWIFFSSALIINLLSQITGYWANKFDIKCTTIVIDEEEGKVSAGTHKRFDCVKSIFNYLTSALNGLSFVTLATGIILVILFVNNKS